MHHDLNISCDNQGVDKLFNKFKDHLNVITNLMINDPQQLINTIWTHDSPIAIDVNCKCLMGEGDRRSHFQCSQCKNIGRIKDFRKKESTFKIQCGIKNGETLMIISHEIPKLFINIDNGITEKARAYIIQHIEAITCGTNINNQTLFISSDKFTNRILIMSMISKIFKEKKLPHLLNLHTAFICGNKGYSLMDHPCIGSLRDLHKISEYHSKPENMCAPLNCNISRSIIYQLIITLKELSYYNFNHGNPSIESLTFEKEKVSYKYDNVNIENQISVKLINFWNASATFNNIHYFSKDIKSEIYVECNVFIPEFETLNNNQYYRLDKNNIDIYLAMNRTGIPIYSGSLDLYCFITSLMCDKSFYLSASKDEKIIKIWSAMWLPDDYNKINKLVLERHYCDIPINNFESTVDIIKGSWLRCDIISYLWNIIKMMK